MIFTQTNQNVGNVTTTLAMPRCATCRHLENGNRPGNYLCGLLCHHPNDLSKYPAQSYSASVPAIFVVERPADFGCTLHEPKE